MRDYYYILGISHISTEIEIKSAYRKLSIKFHPDKNGGDKFFEERFKEIQEAYETLSNTTKRKSYDNNLRMFKNSDGNAAKLKQFEEELKVKFENELRKKEDEIKKKYKSQERNLEEELKRKEDEIKKKYQSPEQKLAEEAELKKREAEIQEKEIEEKRKRKREETEKEIESINKTIEEKCKIKENYQNETKNIDTEVAELKRKLEKLNDQLKGYTTGTDKRGPFYFLFFLILIIVFSIYLNYTVSELSTKIWQWVLNVVLGFILFGLTIHWDEKISKYLIKKAETKHNKTSP